MERHLNITVSGLVQKVGFRFYTVKKAGELGITGFVQNLPDGNVFIEAEGEEADLSVFIDFCRQGPRLAEVRDVKVYPGPVKGYVSFDVR